MKLSLGASVLSVGGSMLSAEDTGRARTTGSLRSYGRSLDAAALDAAAQHEPARDPQSRVPHQADVPVGAAMLVSTSS